MMKWIVFVLVVLLAFVSPTFWHDYEARSFAKFAGGGVTVRPTGNAMSGSGDPISVPGGVGLMMGAEYEFRNNSGKTRRAWFCNGHPDYSEIMMGSGGRGWLLVSLAKKPINDPHTEWSWWVRHMGFERQIRLGYIH